MSQPLLSVNGLMMRFGGLLAVNNVNLELYPQEIVSLIGPNGAGKTTVFNCLTGSTNPPAAPFYCAISILKVYRGSKLPAWAWCAPSSMCVCSVK
ncbi:high-affinity branched-chain amino acid ABC transporter ATP-binding protein [Escherichia coli]|uniref:High-affinity branched-chain amino acid transport ATP-binding protein LivG n=1 Tax=Escherichia coli TaxID=562 RepID=A0A2X1NAL7_ECOLX|nr:high-affinity branched-chain amino acid ABC transporter ATP-binding protein [Escherichia coli]